MRRILIVFIFWAGIFSPLNVVIAANASSAQEASCRAKRREVNSENGGLVRTGGSGKILIHEYSPSCCLSNQDRELRLLADLLRTELVCLHEKGHFSLDSWHEAANSGNPEIHIYLDNASKLPLSLTAPELNRSFINMNRFAAAKDGDTIVQHRLRLMIVRTICRMLGAACSSRAESFLRPCVKLEDFDKICFNTLSFPTLSAMVAYLSEIGFSPIQIMTYREACEAGVAPKPTNDFQKSILAQVLSDKERGPSKPIKISPPNSDK